jgi:hypothetical protein
VIAEARQRALSQERSPDGRDQAKQAVSYARAKIYEREAVADEREIMRDALRRGMGETTFAEVRAEFDSRQQIGEFREVSPDNASRRAINEAIRTEMRARSKRLLIALI